MTIPRQQAIFLGRYPSALAYVKMDIYTLVSTIGARNAENCIEKVGLYRRQSHSQTRKLVAPEGVPTGRAGGIYAGRPLVAPVKWSNCNG